MSKNIYVSRLPYGTTDEMLRGVFGQYGEVKSARVIVAYVDPAVGKTLGFGFVEMGEADADKAICAMKGSVFEGLS